MDKDEIAVSIHEGLKNKDQISLAQIRKEIGHNPLEYLDNARKVMSSYELEDYLANFLKATINVLPYLRSLPIKKQFLLLEPYMSEELGASMKVALLRKGVTSNLARYMRV